MKLININIDIINKNMADAITVVSVKDSVPNNKSLRINGLFFVDDPFIYRNYSADEYIANKLILPKGGCPS